MKDLKIFTDDIEEKAKDQIGLLLSQEAFKDCKIRIMPDVHAGSGCVIGFTGNLGDKVIPNIVGVDIGCGMLCVELGNIDLDLDRLDKVIREYFPSAFHTQDTVEYDFWYFETVHNYISFEDNIVRKGAISAKEGEKVLIPMNMRDGCIIGYGKGNDDWNNSAPHGAGRVMSRMKARETLKLDDFKESMKDVYSTSIKETTIDESPMVYKPMQEIIDNMKDTVEVEKIIKPIYNFKADEDIPYWQK